MTTSLRIVYAGTPEFAVPALQALLAGKHQVVAVYTQPDRPAGRGRHVTASVVKQCALAHAIPVEQPPHFRDAAALKRLASYAPDVMVVAAYGLILPLAVLDIPRYGGINIHASLLPRWRGAAPIQRAILAGDAQTGVTIMRMEAGLDTGPMLLSASVDIGAHEAAAQLHDRLAALGAPLLLEVLSDASSDVSGALARARVQPEAGVSYAKKITKDEARIDWHHSAVEIDRQVRAFNPWPVAQTLLQGEQLRIWQTNSLATTSHAASGTVVAADATGIQVACGRDILNITQLQLAGRNRLSAVEFVKAHALVGECLG